MGDQRRQFHGAPGLLADRRHLLHQADLQRPFGAVKSRRSSALCRPPRVDERPFVDASPP
jgi:hypothetical protein